MRFIFQSVLLLYFSCSLLCQASAEVSLDAHKLSEIVSQTIVYIAFDITDPDTGVKSTVQGTGFVVSTKGHVLTAAHLFRNWNKQADRDKKMN